MRSRFRRASFVLVLIAGCSDPGPPTGTVSGRLTIGGAPPPEPVLISFINSTMGQGGAARTNPDGTYELAEPVRVGEYTVYLSRIIEADVGPVPTDAERLAIVPDEYASETTSPLKETVDEGENSIDLEVPKK